MAKLSRVAGATSQSVNIFIQDSSSTTGAGLSGLVFNSSGLIAYYTFTGANATATQITLATLAAVNSAYSSGGFKEIDATNMKGLYRLDLPNAALATSKGNLVTIQLGGATNMAPCLFDVELTGWDNQDAVHGGMSALPNTACTTNASLITSGNGTDQLTVSGGIASADEKKINGVSTSSVTTVNANIGETQPINFTGTGASALVKSDMTDIAGAAVSTSSAQLGVNVVNIAGQAAALDANNLLKVDAEDWKGGIIPAVNVTGVPKVDVVDWLGSAPNALIAGRVDSNVAVVNTGAIVSGSFGAGAIDSSALNATAASKVWTSPTITEPTAITSSTPTMSAALAMVHCFLRNEITQTATTQTLLANDNATTITTSTLSDDGTTFTKGKFA